MQIAHTTAPAPFVPDVPVVTRSLFDAVAFADLEPFGGFGESNAVRATHQLLRAVDSNRDGAIAMDEARRVVVRDQYTTEHRHSAKDFLLTNYIEASVAYDAEPVLRGADASRDGLVTVGELQSFIQRRAGTVGDASFYAGTAPHVSLVDAFSGAKVLDVVAHREVEYRMPW